jgi:hypothetical protein
VLVELDDTLAQNARDAAAAAGLSGVRVLAGDASLSDTYDGIAPAEIVLACGIFGNISPDDIRNTAASLPMLCAPAATVLWTRYGKPGDDLAPDIARWFDDAGFDLLELHAADEYAFRVGSQRLRVPPRPLERGLRFFTFTR